MTNNLVNKKSLFIALAISIIFLIVVLLFSKKKIENEEILGLRIGMPVSEALKKYPKFICTQVGGYRCSSTIDDSAVQIDINSEERIYQIYTAETINNLDYAQVISAARIEYSNASKTDGDYFYWYFDKNGLTQKYVQITKNFSYDWFCNFPDANINKVPNCNPYSVKIVKSLVDEKQASMWFDKNSPELHKLKQ